MFHVQLLLVVVCKNVILIIEFAVQEKENRGLSVFDAAMEVAKLRFCPILMTSSTFNVADIFINSSPILKKNLNLQNPPRTMYTTVNICGYSYYFNQCNFKNTSS